MEKNYTPLEVGSLYKSDDVLLKVILVVIAFLTVTVVSIMFYVLVKKNFQSALSIIIPTTMPQALPIVAPTVMLFPTIIPATPSPTIQNASISATPIIPAPSQAQNQASSSPKLP